MTTASQEKPQNDLDAAIAGASKTRYWLSRFILLRFLGFIYFIAFLCAVQQIVPLIGHDGLLPADDYLHRLATHFGSNTDGFFELPSVFWFGISDGALLTVSWIGLVLSFIVMCGYANSLIMLALWGLYMSIMNVGQLWYGYGWEMQLLETGFLGVFLCPLFDPRPFPRHAPPVVVFWLYRWLIFRIMLGAGLIKIRGDACWRDLTCLYYHYETQPIPNPISWWLHFRPHWFQKFGVLWNHIIELVVPWFCFYPRKARHAAGVLMAGFQVVLIISGNLSFLNWLTIVPCLACFDDTFWARLLPRALVQRAEAAGDAAALRPSSPAAEFAVVALAFVVAILSIEPVTNLISPGQVMNTSFNRLNLVNTYGAFGTVGRERFEIVF
ncbi:MAG TPA: lipase maturation factor family protein, partial [Chthoniobacter sp.]|nr:lipase maturation factor family protein [Chthoniobacter sp.]